MKIISILLFVATFATAAPTELHNPLKKNAGSSLSNLPAAKKGGTLYHRLMGNPRVLNPVLTGDFDSTEVIDKIYSPLLGRDPETHEYFPMLAEKVEVSKDYKVIVFTLRKDATWEDGTPITADDAEFTFKKLMDPKTDNAPGRAFYEGYQFEKIDQYSFRFLIDKPNINTLSQVGAFGLIQKKQFVNESDFNKSRGIFAPVGSGSYRLKSYSRDQKIELERVKNWWGWKLPQFKNIDNFDSIVYRIVPDSALAYEKFIKGEIDVMRFLAEMYGTRVMGSDKSKFGTSANSGKEVWAAHHMTSAPAQWTYVGWNLKRPMFASKKTRQALGMLIDYDQILDKVFYGTYVRCVSPFGSLTQNTAPEQKNKALRFNPKKALEMLKEDGWSDMDGDGIIAKMIDGKKVKFEFTVRYNSENPMRAKVAQMVKEQFKKAGISVNVQAMEWNAYVNEIDARNFDAIVMGWAGGPIHPDIKQIWHTKSYENKGSNFGAYSNPEVDALVEKANAELDPKKRFKIVQKAGAVIYDDQPYAFVAELPGYLAGYHSRIKASKWFMKYDGVPAIYLFSAQ